MWEKRDETSTADTGIVHIIEMTDDEKIDFVAARILKKYHAAFEELAK